MEDLLLGKIQSDLIRDHEIEKLEKSYEYHKMWDQPEEADHYAKLYREKTGMDIDDE